jgi:hypothetical protein
MAIDSLIVFRNFQVYPAYKNLFFFWIYLKLATQRIPRCFIRLIEFLYLLVRIVDENVFTLRFQGGDIAFVDCFFDIAR